MFKIINSLKKYISESGIIHINMHGIYKPMNYEQCSSAHRINHTAYIF